MKKLKVVSASIFMSLMLVASIGTNLQAQSDPGETCTSSKAGGYTTIPGEGGTIFACIGDPSDCIVVINVPCESEQN